jgi:2'-5' RNA ligase
VALAVCLLFDDRAEAAINRLWLRLESEGISTLLSHTHGRHVPHLTYAALRSYDLDAVASALTRLPEAPPMTLHFDGFGTFRRSRCWLAPAVSAELVAQQEAVVEATVATGADLHRHYRPGLWLPHLTLAPRLRLPDLPVVAAQVYDVLPIVARVNRTALIDTRTGKSHLLPHVV